MADERAKVEAAVYPNIPSEIRAIDSTYIKAYLADNYKNGKISKAELADWQKLTTELVAAHGERAYFMPLRTQFVKAYFPSLVKKSKSKNKESMSDFLANLLEE